MANSPRVLLVGEANPYGGDPYFALWDEPEGASGDRLRRILGLRPSTYRALHRANLCATAWSAPRARERAAILLGDEPSRPWSVVVALGRKVAGALEQSVRAFAGTRQFALPAWSRARLPGWHWPIDVVALPHPSGRCLEWNSRANVLLARDLLRAVAPEVPWGEARDCRCPSARCTCGGDPASSLCDACHRSHSQCTCRLSTATLEELGELGEPSTSDYCLACGESPDSGAHLFGHAYRDPRDPRDPRA